MPGMVLLHVARRLAGAAVSNTTPLVLPRTSDPVDQDDGGLSSLLAQMPLPDNIGWWVVLLILNLLYIVPVCIFLSYAVNNLWPLLCIVESDASPAYEPVALTDVGGEDTSTKDAAALEAAHDHEDYYGGHSSPPHVTHSLRALNQKLYSITGSPLLLHGLRPHMLLNFACFVISGLLGCIPMMPGILTVAIAPLFTVQLYTGWVHIAISAPRNESFWQRLPPFRQCFGATALPTLILWTTVAFSQQAPLLVLSAWDPDYEDPTGLALLPLPKWTGSEQDARMLLCAIAAYFLPSILLVIPAHVILTRVQASMLPQDDNPIVTLDRALQSTHSDKEVLNSMSNALSVTEAWHSFSYAGWARLARMYTKMLLVTLAAEVFMATALILQFMLLWSGSGLDTEQSSST